MNGNLPLIVLAILGATTALAIWPPGLGAVDPAPERASLGASRAFVVDYELYILSEDGTQSLLDTTRWSVAQAANASGDFALRAQSTYAPRRVEWENLTRPIAFADFAFAKIDRAILERPGARIDQIVEDAVGSPDTLTKGEVPRRIGPFPATFEQSHAQVARILGRDPRVGDVVNATQFLQAVVENVTGDVVDLRVRLNQTQAIMARPLASVFSVNLSDDGSAFTLVLNPVGNMSFNLPMENRALGLPPANYMWTGVTATHAAYVSHPLVVPAFIGMDFRLVAEIHEDVQETGTQQE